MWLMEPAPDAQSVDVVTKDIAVAILGFAVALACLSVLWSALVLVGGLLSIVRDDHCNPVARAWLDWYAGPSRTPTGARAQSTAPS